MPEGIIAAPEDGTDLFGGTASPTPSGLGAVAASGSPNVHMIGDFFSSGYFLGSGGGNFASTPIGGADRRFKATDNLNPLPQDRVFFNYHHFHNAVTDVTGESQNIDRMTFGLEMTFFDEICSLEFRAPFTSGLTSDQDLANADTTSGEFGNLALTMKTLLWTHNCLSFTSGLAIVFPTADDAQLRDDSGATLLENNAYHLQPYLGVNYSNPCRRLFWTAYAAVDVDSNGNDLFTEVPFSFGTAFVPVANVRDQTQVFADLQIGYWLYRDYGHIGFLNAIAPVFELHYSHQAEAPVNVGGLYENPFGRATLLNMTAGMVFDFRRNRQLTVYGAAPLRREETPFNGLIVSPVFDAEFGVQWVRQY